MQEFFTIKHILGIAFITQIAWPFLFYLVNARQYPCMTYKDAYIGGQVSILIICFSAGLIAFLIWCFN